MSLDAPMSDAQLLALATCECTHLTSDHFAGRGPCCVPGCRCRSWTRQRAPGVVNGTVNGITLGPDSPIRRAAPTSRRSSNSGVHEHEIQVAFFANVNSDSEQQRRPALALVFAVPNGGKRTPRTAGRLKAEGVKSGPPDVWCPVARGRYHGLVIEFKKPGGATSPEQAHWLSALAREGWKTALHTTPEGAWAELVTYLDQEA